MIETIIKFGLEYFGLYYGIYKAQVVRNDDPNNQGRLQVFCPQVHGPKPAPIWAYPKTASAGSQFGLWIIPDVGDWVYVSFDHGRPEFPIWDGGWWGTGETTPDMIPKKVVLATKEGLKIVIDRTDNTILLHQGAGNEILLESGQITLTSALVKIPGAVEIDGPLTVNADMAITGNITGSGDIGLTGDVTVTGSGHVSGSWLTDGLTSAHHIHTLSPIPNPTVANNTP